MLEEQIKTYVTSLIRTVTPILVGNLLGWLASMGLPLPEEVKGNLSMLLILVTGALFTIAYYALFRWLELRHPGFGVFLGSKKQPIAYSRTPEDDKKTIGIALEATRDREPDEDGEEVPAFPPAGEPEDLTPPREGYQPRHLRGKRAKQVDW